MGKPADPGQFDMAPLEFEADSAPSSRSSARSACRSTPSSRRSSTFAFGYDTLRHHGVRRQRLPQPAAAVRRLVSSATWTLRRQRRARAAVRRRPVGGGRAEPGHRPRRRRRRPVRRDRLRSARSRRRRPGPHRRARHQHPQRVPVRRAAAVAAGHLRRHRQADGRAVRVPEDRSSAFFAIDEKFDITDADRCCSTSRSTSSGSRRWPPNCGDGVLQLNMGKFADQRIEGDLTDWRRSSSIVDAGRRRPRQGLGTRASASIGAKHSTYEVTSLILALGGEGNDIIDLSLVTRQHQV